jgi:hypothetical protein
MDGVYIRGARISEATRHKTFNLSTATMMKTTIILALLQLVTAANLRELFSNSEIKFHPF